MAIELSDSSASFVGRVAELARLRAALEHTAAGSGRVVMLVGEAGIGKTRTAAEFAAHARAAGALVLRGACYEGEWAPPYGPIVEALTVYVRQSDPFILSDELGFGAAPLARVVPAIRERLPDVPEPVALQQDEERFRLFDAVSQFLIAIARQRTVVLWFDDLHWADKGTIALLRHMARFAPQHALLLGGAYRDDEIDATHPLAKLLGALRRESTYERVLLSGLDRAQTEELVTAVAEANLASAVVSDIHRHTRGNPFFIRETVQHLREEGRLTDAQSALPELPVPAGIRHVVERRLARLSADANRLLTVAAAFDGRFLYRIVATVAALAFDAALAATDEALGARLIEPTVHADTYDFTHALIRHTLYTALSPSRRARLHRQLAEAMEQLYGQASGEHAAEIAQQYYRSKDLPDAQRGVTYALTAADRAATAYAHDEVVAHLRVATELMPKSDPRYPRVLSRLGLALGSTPEFHEAPRIAEEAAELLASSEGTDAAADYVAEVAMSMWSVGLRRSRWATLMAKGLRYVGERRDLTWLRLMVNDILRREEDTSSIVDSTERRAAAELANRLELSSFERLVFAANGFPSVSSRADALERFADDPDRLMLAAGEYRRSLPLFEAWAIRHQQSGRVGDAAICWAQFARAHTAMGAFAAAQRAYDQGATLAARLPPHSQPMLYLAVARQEMRMGRGEGWLTGPTVQRSPTEDGGPPFWASGAQVWAWLARPDQALALVQMVLDALHKAPGWAANYTAMVCDVAGALWLLKRTDYSEVVERNLRTKVIAADFRYPMRDARLCMAYLSALDGRVDDAVDWFAQARMVLDEQGARPLRAIVDYDEALMYARRGGDGDRERSHPLLEAALAQFRAIGMPGWIRRAEHLLTTGIEWSASQSAGGSGQSPAPADTQHPTPDSLPTPNTRHPEPSTCLIRCEGDVWAIEFAGATHRIKDSRGLRYLALLFAHPGREFHASEIVALSKAPAPTERRVGLEEMRVADLGDAGALLDATATAQYKQRLDSLRAELAEAEANNDLGRTTGLRRELELLVAALGGAHRGRRAVSYAERARSAVSKRIRAALKQISTVDPTLGRHLDLTVRTGTFCSYRPAPALQIDARA